MGPASQAVVVSGAGRSLTHGRLRDRAARLASVFHSRGLAAGDVIAVLTSDPVGVMELLVAAEHAGLIALPVDPAFSLEEAAYVVNDSGAVAAVVGDDFAPMAAPLTLLTPAVKLRWSFGVSVEGHAPLELARSGAVPRPRFDSDPGTLHYGGATGRPTARLVQDDPGGIADLLAPGVVVLSTSAPSDPVSCRLRLSALARGGTVVSGTYPTVAGVGRAIAAHRPAILELSPRVATQLAQLGDGEWAELAHDEILCVLVAAGCPAEALAQLTERWGARVREYGVTAPARDVERSIAAHPAVADVAVLDRAPLVAIVEAVPGVIPGPELEGLLLAHLAEGDLQLPEDMRIQFTSRLPRTVSGAVDARRLMPRDYV